MHRGRHDTAAFAHVAPRGNSATSGVSRRGRHRARARRV